MKRFAMALIISAALAAGVFTGCAGTAASSTESAASTASVASASADASASAGDSADSNASDSSGASASASSSQATASTASTTVNGSSNGVLNASDLFSDRDLKQVADTSGAKAITVSSGEDVTISEEGVYVISGTAEDATITVDADDSAKVQLVLDGLSITNSDAPAIFVASADKVFITTAEGTTNQLSVTGTFATTADDNFDGAIYAKDDIVLNGQGTLAISSTANGIVGKDDVKVTGGTYIIVAGEHGIQGKDSVRIADGDFTIKAGTDAIHSKNSDDLSLGYIYIAGGTFDLTASSDGIGATSVAQIDGGTFAINSSEGIEGTYVQVNGGTVDIQASDDGINATSKSNAYNVIIEINDGDISINMGSGDTDALDSNGDLIINGGTVDITAQFAFDFDGVGELNGGTVTVNGEEVTELTNSMMMGGPGNMGNMPGGPNGRSDNGTGAPQGNNMGFPKR